MVFLFPHCTGAMVAISHDIEFCEAMNPTHIARVEPNGTVSVSLCINGDLRTSQKSKPQAATPAATKEKKPTATTSFKPAKTYGGSAHVKPIAGPDPKRIHMVSIVVALFSFTWPYLCSTAQVAAQHRLQHSTGCSTVYASCKCLEQAE